MSRTDPWVRIVMLDWIGSFLWMLCMPVENGQNFEFNILLFCYIFAIIMILCWRVWIEQQLRNQSKRATWATDQRTASVSHRMFYQSEGKATWAVQRATWAMPAAHNCPSVVTPLLGKYIRPDRVLIIFENDGAHHFSGSLIMVAVTQFYKLLLEC